MLYLLRELLSFNNDTVILFSGKNNSPGFSIALIPCRLPPPPPSLSLSLSLFLSLSYIHPDNITNIILYSSLESRLHVVNDIPSPQLPHCSISLICSISELITSQSSIFWSKSSATNGAPASFQVNLQTSSSREEVCVVDKPQIALIIITY